MAEQYSDLLAVTRPSFDSASGLTIPDTQTIRSAVVSALVKCFRVNATDDDLRTAPGTPGGQLVDLLTAEIAARNAEISYIVNQISPYTARGIHLDRLAQLYGIDRKISEPTVVTCTCRGLRGTVIPYGAIVQDTLGNQLRQSTVGGLTIGANGTVTGPFSTIEHGAIEIGAHTVTKIVTVIAGWDAVDNDAAGSTGRATEPDGELYNRMTQSYAINAHGSVKNIEANLAELDGVLDVVVLENYTNKTIIKYSVSLGPHSIACCIVGGKDDDIAKVLFQRKDLGCDTMGETQVTYIDTEHFNAKYVYNIIRPTSATFKVRVHFYDEAMAPDYITAVKKAVVSDFLGEGRNARVKIATTVPASRFYKVVQDVVTADVKNIEVSLGDAAFGDHVDIPANVEPTIDEDAVELVFGGA